MKKMLFVAAMALLSGAVLAKPATLIEDKNPPTHCMKAWTPLSLNIVTPVGLPWGFDWDVKGLQVGIWNWVPDFDGWQIGLVNTTDRFRGLQLGVVNVTRQMYGVQVGVVNVIETNDIPFLPIINCYF